MNITLYLKNGFVAYLPDRYSLRDMGEEVHIMTETGELLSYPWKSIKQIKIGKEEKDGND